MALAQEPVTNTLAVAALPPDLTADLEAAPAEAIPDLQNSVNLSSLIISLVTIVATLSMLLIVQVRVLPRQTLVHSMLWAVNCGLVAYILYSVGWVPGCQLVARKFEGMGRGHRCVYRNALAFAVAATASRLKFS